MNENCEQTYNKLDKFFRTSLNYFGKEIGLASNQYFSIDQLCDEDKEKDGEYSYAIQYGFPQSGCVSLKFGYSEKTKSFTVEEVSVYAPPAGEKMMMANYAPEFHEGAVGINVNFGIDIGTQEHASVQEIENNPNALEMLDIAFTDLSQAQVLGDCNLFVSSNSRRIPCCSSTYITNNKAKNM